MKVFPLSVYGVLYVGWGKIHLFFDDYGALTVSFDFRGMYVSNVHKSYWKDFLSDENDWIFSG